MNQPSPSAATSIPLETLQAFGLAGKVQQEFQRQRWLSALPEARDPLPEAELGGEPLRMPPHSAASRASETHSDGVVRGLDSEE